MAKEDIIELTGEVIEALPSATFKVRLANKFVVICHTSGRIRQNHIRIAVGDSVTVEMTSYDLTKGRISYRHK